MISPTFLARSVAQVKKLRGKKFAVSTFCRPLGVWFTKSSYFSCTSHPECSFLCANIYLNIYIFSNFNIFESGCIPVYVFTYVADYAKKEGLLVL